MGDTGSGKSTAIRQLLRQVQERGESAIVYDPAMDFVGEFYDPKRGDLILNPLDARCPYWNLGAEEARNEVGLDVSHHTRISQRGGEKLFLLTSSFIG
jgi:DNA helicase HerA-like ATPase